MNKFGRSPATLLNRGSAVPCFEAMLNILMYSDYLYLYLILKLQLTPLLDKLNGVKMTSKRRSFILLIFITLVWYKEMA